MTEENVQLDKWREKLRESANTPGITTLVYTDYVIAALVYMQDLEKKLGIWKSDTPFSI